MDSAHEFAPLGVQGNYIKLGGKSVLSLGEETNAVFSSNSEPWFKVTIMKGKIYGFSNKFDKEFINLNDLVGWLNKNGYRYTGVESNEEA